MSLKENTARLIGTAAAGAAAAGASILSFAQPAFAAANVSSSDAAAKCEHTYSAWTKIQEPGFFLELGKAQRECSACGTIQQVPIVSPLLGVVIGIVAICLITALVQLFAKFAVKFKKGFQKFLVVLVVLFLIIMLLGAGVYSINKGAGFGVSLLNGLVQLIGAKGFYAKNVNDCIYMMFGSIACKIINGLFYFTVIALICAIIALIKATIAGVKKGAQVAKDKIDETASKIIGKD